MLRKDDHIDVESYNYSGCMLNVNPQSYCYKSMRS